MHRRGTLEGMWLGSNGVLVVFLVVAALSNNHPPYHPPSAAGNGKDLQPVRSPPRRPPRRRPAGMIRFVSLA